MSGSGQVTAPSMPALIVNKWHVPKMSVTNMESAQTLMTNTFIYLNILTITDHIKKNTRGLQ